MKQIINIVEIQSGVISKITSFILPEETSEEYQEAIAYAKDKFIDIIYPYLKTIWTSGRMTGTIESSWEEFKADEIEEALESGFVYGVMEVVLIWSEDVR